MRHWLDSPVNALDRSVVRKGCGFANVMSRMRGLSNSSYHGDPSILWRVVRIPYESCMPSLVPVWQVPDSQEDPQGTLAATAGLREAWVAC